MTTRVTEGVVFIDRSTLKYILENFFPTKKDAALRLWVHSKYKRKLDDI